MELLSIVIQDKAHPSTTLTHYSRLVLSVCWGINVINYEQECVKAVIFMEYASPHRGGIEGEYLIQGDRGIVRFILLVNRIPNPELGAG